MDSSCTAFAGDMWIASGSPEEVRLTLRAIGDDPAEGPILVFDDRTGKQIDIDMREHAQARPRGRPWLGVVAGEVTLLPRHWDWLKEQRGGASAAVRRLIDEARQRSGGPEAARDAAYCFMTAIAGNRPGYEEAIRALYAGDGQRFGTLIADWPVSIRDHALSLAETRLRRVRAPCRRSHIRG